MLTALRSTGMPTLIVHLTDESAEALLRHVHDTYPGTEVEVHPDDDLLDVPHPPAPEPITREAFLAELDRRVADYKSGKVKGISYEDVILDLNARIRRSA